MFRRTVYMIMILVPAILLNKSTIAQEQFNTEYDIYYEINPNGETKVTQNITIENKLKDVIAKNYSLSINQMNIYDINASNDKDVLDTKISQDQKSASIKVVFEDEIIGEGRKNKFKIEFKSKDIATKVGEVWNINFPNIQLSDSTKEYTVTLKVPSVFGPEIYIAPQADEVKKENNYSIYKFYKNSVENKGITASFGKYQTLNFKLKYQIENDSNFSALHEIALPSDIKDMQNVAYLDISPKPESLKKDQDGNLIASFKLTPKQKLQIALNGSARILGNQINPSYGGKFEEIQTDLIKKYTKEDKYWEIYDPKIIEISKNLLNKEISVSENAKSAYNYVIKNLKYNFDIVKNDFIPRSGAAKALNSKGLWGCMEFTDSFIALTRAMGIPSREINGYAFATDNISTPISINLKGGDLLHSWAEYYDPNFGWVAVDPTWGATSGVDYFSKLDTNHFAFVIKGMDSEYPLPAGAYRTDNFQERLISVDFAQNNSNGDFKESLMVEQTISLNPLKTLKGLRNYKVSNIGQVVLYSINDEANYILPGESLNIYMPKNPDKISYKDFNNVQKSIGIYLPEDYLFFGYEYISLLIPLILGLLTFMSFYLLIIRPMVLRK